MLHSAGDEGGRGADTYAMRKEPRASVIRNKSPLRYSTWTEDHLGWALKESGEFGLEWSRAESPINVSILLR